MLFIPRLRLAAATLTLFLLSGVAHAQAPAFNLALLDGNEYSASSVYPNPGFGVLGAFDGDRKGYGWGNGGGWNDGTRDIWPDWLQVKFKRPMSVKRAVVASVQYALYTPEEPYVGMGYCGTHGIHSLELHSSDDGVTWTKRAALEHNYECVKEIVLEKEVRAQYWRFVVTASGDHYSRIVEGELYSR